MQRSGFRSIIPKADRLLAAQLWSFRREDFDDGSWRGAGKDAQDGGAGNDTAAGVNVSLATATGTGGDAQGDTLINFEKLIGSSQNDTLEGNNGDNILNGGAGVDTVSYANARSRVEVSLAQNGETGY
jgi:hypothetical protein